MGQHVVHSTGARMLINLGANSIIVLFLWGRPTDKGKAAGMLGILVDFCFIEHISTSNLLNL